MSIFIFMFIFIFFIIISLSTTSSTSLENLLIKRKFSNIHTFPVPQYPSKVFLTATQNNMNYLFVKNLSLIELNSTFMQSIQQIAKTLKSDRIIIYYYLDTIPIEQTKLAASYNIEIWNKFGTSNYSSYRTTPANTNNSRLAKALTKENEPLEYRKNGVIAKDTCHIAPTISPIQTQTKKSIFKKKETQRL